MYNKPHPIGYVEIQRAWVGLALPLEDRVPELMQDIREQVAREYPGLVFHGSRLERTYDGAGVPYYNLYVGFAPAVASSEPLDPRNLNASDKAEQIGDPMRDNAIGMKEQRF